MGTALKRAGNTTPGPNDITYVMPEANFLKKQSRT